jgi:hypothetical protein
MNAFILTVVIILIYLIYIKLISKFDKESSTTNDKTTNNTPPDKDQLEAACNESKQIKMFLKDEILNYKAGVNDTKCSNYDPNWRCKADSGYAFYTSTCPGFNKESYEKCIKSRIKGIVTYDKTCPEYIEGSCNKMIDIEGYSEKKIPKGYDISVCDNYNPMFRICEQTIKGINKSGWEKPDCPNYINDEKCWGGGQWIPTCPNYDPKMAGVGIDEDGDIVFKKGNESTKINTELIFETAGLDIKNEGAIKSGNLCWEFPNGRAKLKKAMLYDSQNDEVFDNDVIDVLEKMCIKDGDNKTTKKGPSCLIDKVEYDKELNLIPGTRWGDRYKQYGFPANNRLQTIKLVWDCVQKST